MLLQFLFLFFFCDGAHTLRLYILYKTWRILSGVSFHAAPFPRPQVTGSPDKASRAQAVLCKYLRSVAQVRALMWVCSGVRRGLRTRYSSRLCTSARMILFETSIRSSAILRLNKLCSVFRYSVFHDGLAASEERPRPRDTLFWDYNGERKIRGIPSGLSIVACPRVLYRALDRASAGESITGDWTCAHTAVCNRFGIICSEIRVPVSGLVWNAPRTRAIKRRIKLHRDRPKVLRNCRTKAKDDAFAFALVIRRGRRARTCVKRMPRYFLLVLVIR